MPLRKILFVKRIKAVLGISAKQQKASSRVFKAFNGLFSFVCLFVCTRDFVFGSETDLPKCSGGSENLRKKKKKRKEGQELKELESDQKKRC